MKHTHLAILDRELIPYRYSFGCSRCSARLGDRLGRGALSNRSLYFWI